MECLINRRVAEPSLYFCDSIIIEVNNEFIDFTGFAVDELVGKSSIEIGDMLRLNSQVFFDSVNSNYSAFIFTKSLEPREVNISCIYNKGSNKKIYTLSEKDNSRLKDKLLFVEQTFIENVRGAAIYSATNAIVLKVNQRYLDFLEPPFNKEENSIGTSINECLTRVIGNKLQTMWNIVIETQKSTYIKEFRFDDLAKGISYWDVILTPIFESGKMKYIYITATEVTKMVIKNQGVKRKNKMILHQNEKLEEQNKKIEQQNRELEEKNTQLASIIENLSEGVIISDNKGKVIMINSEAKKLIHRPLEHTALGEICKNTKYFDMEGNEILHENTPTNRALKGESVKNARILVKNSESEYFMKISSLPIYNVNGDLLMVVSCFHNITDTIKKSKKIQEQKKELEAVIENISEGIAIVNKKGQYTLLNKAAREGMFLHYEYMDKARDGYKQCEMYDSNGEKVNIEDIPARRVGRGEKFNNMRMTLKIPNKILQLDISGTPIYDNKGQFSLGVICCRDMTNYINHEETIRSRFELLDKIIDTFDLPVIRLSCPDLKVVDINKKALKIIELLRPDVKSIKQIKGKAIEYFFNADMIDEYYNSINEVVEEKKTKYLNKKKHFINGSETYWNFIFEPLLDANGETQEILMLTIDVTSEIKANIIMENALKSQEEIFANISHELKTPLNIIFSTAQLLNMYCESDSLDQRKSSIIKYINSIKQNSYRLSKLINNIVDLSKIQAGFFELKLSNNNIVEVVEETVMSVTNFTEVKGINIIFDTDVEEKNIACDPEKIARVVLNLISNAIKFSEIGNEILVEIKDKDEFVEISVKDSGIGIEDHNLDMIFDRFKQVDKSLSRNAEGTGIGLSLVKSIVELHEGHIYVESKFGEGSRFIVVLPSRELMQGNMSFDSKIRTKIESVQVELSDIIL
jgi:signal transduction histidine kinase/PAS domain-containing protein